MAVDNKNSSLFGGIFGGYQNSDPTMNVGVTSNPVTAQISPFLNVDPSYLTNQPEFISLEGARPRRGRFEMAFSQIGGLVLVGGGIGAAQGLYKGLQQTKLSNQSAAIKRTQLLNYVSKRVSGTANTLGTIAVMYSVAGCLLYWGRGSKEDSANTLLAGSLTGALYQSSGGLKKAGVGGLVGLALAGAFVAFTSKDRIKDKYGY